MSLNSTQKVRAQDDFYHYVNDEWLNDPQNKIPDEYPSWGSFMKLRDDSLKKQIQLTKNLADVPNRSVEEEKVYAIWTAATTLFESWNNDKDNKDNINYDPITNELNLLNSIINDDSKDIVKRVSTYLHYCQVNGISNVVDFDTESDFENANNVVLTFQCGKVGLSLPSKEYYFDESFVEKREQFRQHLTNVQKLINNVNNDNFVDNVIQFEHDIATFCMTSDQERRYDEYYTNTSLEQIYAKVNDLITLPDKYEDSDNVNESLLNNDQIQTVTNFMETLYELFNFREVLATNLQKNYLDKGLNNPPKTHHITAFDGDCIRRVLMYILNPDNLMKYKSFLQYKIIASCKQYCTRELYEEFFDFYNRKLNGQKEMQSIEKRSMNIVNALAGELMGKIYVDKYFPATCKSDVLDSISEIIDVMKESLKTNDWLTDQTKQNALQKLSKFNVKIGYPDVWKDYSKFDIILGDSLYQISKKAKQWYLQVAFYDKLNSVLDRNEWHMTPQTVNAYFDPMQNEIVFPAAILQPPFYSRNIGDIDFNIDDEKNCNDELLVKSVNFGGMGAVIAHEITHGYDDQGKKFDGDGNLREWWLQEDEELFKQKTELMARQVEKYKFVDTDTGKEYKMNAQLTMGENLADLGGVNLSLKALHNHLTKNNVEPNSELFKAYLRVFFKSFANIWKQNATTDSLINRITTDPHAATDFRANMVKNVDSFYDVFDVKEGDGMYISKEERVTMY